MAAGYKGASDNQQSSHCCGKYQSFSVWGEVHFPSKESLALLDLLLMYIVFILLKQYQSCTEVIIKTVPPTEEVS